ncbi:SDR family oxidoreductase [Nocardia flavorosea]|uniref:SDR family oxidoreductase n=1 Tax=Nocardia flavorosea TaxID=53429 RepID=A0A846YN92_9NOCA|nr:SDR family oxidoreductase [Nocardia flavorosea]
MVGGSGAIGRAVAERLAEMGADIALGYSSRREAADAAARAVRDRGCRAEPVCLDMRDAAGAAAAVQRAGDLLGGLHTVVLAASPTNSQFYAGSLPDARYLDQLTVDAGGSYAIVRAALPLLRESRGSIVAVTTVANRRYVLRDVLSTAPKAANEALVRAVAAEEGRYGVRANAVGVGILDEGMTERLVASGDIRPGDLEHALGRIPLRAFGKAADIAEVAGFLASERARYVTGQWIDVDGGYSL